MTTDGAAESAAGPPARLRALAGDRDALDIAQLQFVGMDELKRAHTHRWPEQHARILEIAQSFLTQRIPAGDLLVRANDGFVLVFQSTEAEANVSAGRLAHGLNAYFLAEAS